jgi:hypothetical protein
MKSISLFIRWAAALAVFATGAAWAQVATLAELSGAAQAIPAAGAPRDLRKGDALNQGDTVRTAAGSSAVIRFEDGQVVALTANSRFTIANYQYNKAEPAKSSVLLNLVEGGMRAVTGLIGKAKPENVTYRAANATIGIRGTDVTIGVSGGNLVVSVKDGKVSFTFGGRTVEIPAGQGTYVPSGTTNVVVVSNNDLSAAIAKASDAGAGALRDAIGALQTMAAFRSPGEQQRDQGSPQTGTVRAVGSGDTAGARITSGTGAGGGQNCNVVPRPSGC